MKFVNAHIEDGDTDVRVGRCGARGLHAFAVELARDRASRMVPRHSYSYRIERRVGSSWLLCESLPSLAHAVARVDSWIYEPRRIVCEGVMLGSVNACEKWFRAA